MPTDPNPRARLGDRRRRLAQAWDLPRGLVLAPAGLPLPIAGTDQVHDFHPHPEHYYLSGLTHPGAVLAFDPGEGWTLFAEQLGIEDRVWTNASEALSDQAHRAGLDTVRDRRELAPWLERRRGETVALIGNRDLLDHPSGYDVPSWTALELDVDEPLSDRLSQAVSEARRTKDGQELALMRAAAVASIAGHRAGIAHARPGLTERELQIEIEAEFFRNGGDRTAYGSIVGGGPNGATLHFAPTTRPFRDGDIILVDAGAEVDGYASDVTRTYPVASTFTPEQRDLYDLVFRTQRHAIETARPGIEYKDLHLAAARDIAQGLADLGLLHGDPASLVEQDAHALFFPHGLGHMLGLATHDAGGCLAGREPSDRFGLKYLRADLPLQPGYVVTIEPGIYFIDALLTDPARREQYRDAVDWDRVDRLRGFGGIRIEDDVLITDNGCELLSAELPRAADEIEELRRAALAS